jgi:hypothetical protein
MFVLMVEGCLDFNGTGLEELGVKFVSMGCDGSSIF